MDQGSLCAYCEIKIIENSPLKRSIEHFHPKSDRSSRNNWATDWDNLLLVCTGGSRPENQSNREFFLRPLPQNLSCDQSKGDLKPQGRILNPLYLPLRPCIFRFTLSGEVIPHDRNCKLFDPWPNNTFENLSELVLETISTLNLNCTRLKEARKILIEQIEREKKDKREKGVSPEVGLREIAERFFNEKWPKFFTVIRWSLGDQAEIFLKEIGFSG